MEDPIVVIENFKKYGFTALDDTTKARPGSLRVMRNAQITLRGGLAPRPGTLLLGSSNTSSKRVRGFFNFRKSLGSDELLVKCYDTEMEYLSKTYQSAGWTRLKNSFTSDKEFGFMASLVNTSNQDYVLGCNRYEPYFSWTGAVARLSGNVAAAALSVPVDSTLLPDVYESKTATGNSATTVTVATANWATSQWVNFYIRIPGTGAVRKITANTATVLTFDTLGVAPGNVAFEIRKLAFPATGTIIYNGTTVPYTGIATDSAFTVASAAAGTSGQTVALVPTDYPAAPRGNRLANYLGRTIVGNVRSALARDTGGALQGYSSAGSVFVSKQNDPTDFSYAAARVAGEGDIIAMPYGGGDITDVQTQESQFYAFKGEYIEAASYTQDTNDLVQRDPLKTGVGSAGKTIKGRDDIYFITKDKQFTSIGRVKQADIKPQTLDLGHPIDRYLSTCGVDDVGRGREISGKIYIPLKSDEDQANNNALLVFNRDTKAFEGVWDIGAFGIEEWNGGYYYAESDGPNVRQLFYEHADVEGDNRFGIDFEVATHFMNLTGKAPTSQASMGLIIEGYVAGGATFQTNVWKDFSDTPELTFDFSFDEEGFLDGEETRAFMGATPLGIDPKGTVTSDPDADGRRHFMFRTYYPHMYGNFFSFGFSDQNPDSDFEITRFALIMKENPTVNMNKIKAL